MMRTAFKPKKPAQSERGKERGGRSGQRHVRSETANTITNRSLLDACLFLVLLCPCPCGSTSSSGKTKGPFQTAPL